MAQQSPASHAPMVKQQASQTPGSLWAVPLTDEHRDPRPRGPWEGRQPLPAPLRTRCKSQGSVLVAVADASLRGAWPEEPGGPPPSRSRLAVCAPVASSDSPGD